MKIKLLTLSITTALAFGGVFQAQAAPKKDASPSPSPAASAKPSATPTRPIPFTGKVFSVDKAAKTFSTQSKEKKIRVFAITATSKITKGAAAGTLDDVKEGLEVRGSALAKGDGRYDVISLKIGPKEDATKGAPTAAPATSPSPDSKKKK